MMDWIKNNKKITVVFIFIIILASFLYCAYNGWVYYFFDIIAKCSPGIAGFAAYYMWSKNRDRELKELEYKNDYYKKIIDKRIEAYEKISFFINIISVVDTFVIPNNGGISGKAMDYFTCFKDLKSLEEALEKSAELGKWNGWATTRTRKSLVRINNLLADAYLVVANPNQEEMAKLILTGMIPGKQISKEDEKYLSVGLGCKQYHSWSIEIEQLKQFVYDDFKNMDKVSEFLDQNK